MQIKWKTGTHYKVDAEVAHKAIEDIRKKNDGEVTAEHVVKAAKAARHVLHDEFEWDDKAAAHEHRLATARHMVRCLVVVRDDTSTTRPQRMYEVVQKPQEKPRERKKFAYKTVEDILQDEDLRAELLNRALQELIRIRNRYRDLQELAIVMRAIDEAISALEIA